MNETHPAPAAPTGPSSAPHGGPIMPEPVRNAGQGGHLSWGLVALSLAVVALVLGGLTWQKLTQTQQELARRTQDSLTQVTEARQLAAQSETMVQELQARLALAELRLSEVSLQRSQLEELMLTLSRSRDDNLVQDLEATLRLAQQQAQLTGSAQPLISALQALDQRIARAAQPRLNPVQRAIARDTERLQAAMLVDVPALASRLDELMRQVDEWPLLNDHRPIAPKARPLAPARLPDEPQDAPQPAPPESNEPTTMARGWARVSSWWSQSWAQVWHSVTEGGRELVRVSRIDRPEAVLLAPEQGFFLRENLKLKLLNARLGLLSRQMASARADLASVQAGLERYFDTQTPVVRGASQALSQLRRDMADHDMPRPEETLAALATAAAGR